MTVATGTKLGRYEIRSKIGAGGMGEVYLAQDTKLDRKVALKVLPADVASNRDRMERFVREAKSAAVLNHPYIAQIFEIGENEGTHFIAMEFIDGLTLTEKIHRDRASLGQLLKYLTQVAEGLAKAHAAGIVHRDLKPDNIMITRDGFAKILDFGLAKLVEPQRPFDSSGTGSSEIATAVLAQQSIPGMVMGTVGYMSPEQAQGKTKEIDHRSDIFSFGCILFEAATGKKAFEGKDALDSLHKIVHAPTPQIKEINPVAPDELQRIVRRCLAKEPDKRYQSIKEVAIELEELQLELKSASELKYSAQPASSGAAASTGTAQAASGHSSASGTLSIGTAHPTSSAEYLFSEIKRHKGGVFLVLAGIAVLVAGAAFGLYTWTGQRQRGGASQPLKITRLTSTGKATRAAISPDGKYVAYAQDEGGQQSLWVTQVAVSNPNQIVPPADVDYDGLTFSRDVNFVYYVRTDKDNPNGALYKAPVLGGQARKLLVNVSSPISLSPDGKQLAFVREDPSQNGGQREYAFMIANEDGSAEKKLAVHKISAGVFYSRGGPAWSPDGRTIAYGQVHRMGDSGSGGYRNVIAVRVADGVEQPITSQRWDGPLTPFMRIVWLADNSGVLVTGAEQETLHQIWYLAWPGNEARSLTDGLNDYEDISLTADSGTLSAVRSDRVVNLWIAPNGEARSARQITSGAGREDGSRGISWTPDGKIVYHSTAGGNQNIWITEADGAGNKQLSPQALENSGPAVSPDGRYVVWASWSGALGVWRMEIDGSNPKKLTARAARSPHVSPDGKWVVYSHPNNIVIKIPIDGGDEAQLTDKPAGGAVISPDGKLIACNYQEEATRQFKIAIIPFEGGPPTRVFDLLGGPNRSLWWTPDGRAIAYIVTSNGVSNIWAQPLAGGEPKPLTDFKDQRIFNFAWSRDGKQLALSRGVVNSDVVLITNFR